MVPCAVSTAYTLLTPKSSALTRMPVTGQFSMIWSRVRAAEPRQHRKGCRTSAHLIPSPQIWKSESEQWSGNGPFQQLLLLVLIPTHLSPAADLNRSSVPQHLQRVLFIYLHISKATHQGQAGSSCLKE